MVAFNQHTPPTVAPVEDACELPHSHILETAEQMTFAKRCKWPPDGDPAAVTEDHQPASHSSTAEHHRSYKASACDPQGYAPALSNGKNQHLGMTHVKDNSKHPHLSANISDTGSTDSDRDSLAQPRAQPTPGGCFVASDSMQDTVLPADYGIGVESPVRRAAAALGTKLIIRSRNSSRPHSPQLSLRHKHALEQLGRNPHKQPSQLMNSHHMPANGSSIKRHTEPVPFQSIQSDRAAAVKHQSSNSPANKPPWVTPVVHEPCDHHIAIEPTERPSVPEQQLESDHDPEIAPSTSSLISAQLTCDAPASSSGLCSSDSPSLSPPGTPNYQSSALISENEALQRRLSEMVTALKCAKDAAAASRAAQHSLRAAVEAEGAAEAQLQATAMAALQADCANLQHQLKESQRLYAKGKKQQSTFLQQVGNSKAELEKANAARAFAEDAMAKTVKAHKLEMASVASKAAEKSEAAEKGAEKSMQRASEAIAAANLRAEALETAKEEALREIASLTAAACDAEFLRRDQLLEVAEAAKAAEAREMELGDQVAAMQEGLNNLRQQTSSCEDEAAASTVAAAQQVQRLQRQNVTLQQYVDNYKVELATAHMSLEAAEKLAKDADSESDALRERLALARDQLLESRNVKGNDSEYVNGLQSDEEPGSSFAMLQAANAVLLEKLEEAEVLCNEAAKRHEESECIITDLAGRLQDASLPGFDPNSAAVQRCKTLEAQLANGRGVATQLQTSLYESKTAAAEGAKAAAVKLDGALEQASHAKLAVKSLQDRIEVIQRAAETAQAAHAAEKEQLQAKLSDALQGAANALARAHTAERGAETSAKEAAAVDARARALRSQLTTAEHATKGVRRRALRDSEFTRSREATLKRNLAVAEQHISESSLQLVRLETRGKVEHVRAQKLAAELARLQQKGVRAISSRARSDTGQQEKADREVASDTMSVFSEGYITQVAQTTEQETAGEVARLLSALNAAAADAEAERAVSAGLLTEVKQMKQQQAALDDLLDDAAAKCEEIVHLKQVVSELREAEDSAANSAIAEAGRAEGLATLLGVIDGLMSHARPLLAPPLPPDSEAIPGHDDQLVLSPGSQGQPALGDDKQPTLEQKTSYQNLKYSRGSQRAQAMQEATAAANTATAAVSNALATASRQEAAATAVAAARRFGVTGGARDPRASIRLPSIAWSAAGREVSEILSSSGSELNQTPDSDRNLSVISGLATGEALTDEPSTPMPVNVLESDVEATPHDSMETQQHLRLRASRQHRSQLGRDQSQHQLIQDQPALDHTHLHQQQQQQKRQKQQEHPTVHLQQQAQLQRWYQQHQQQEQLQQSYHQQQQQEVHRWQPRENQQYYTKGDRHQHGPPGSRSIEHETAVKLQQITHIKNPWHTGRTSLVSRVFQQHQGVQQQQQQEQQPPQQPSSHTQLRDQQMAPTTPAASSLLRQQPPQNHYCPNPTFARDDSGSSSTQPSRLAPTGLGNSSKTNSLPVINHASTGDPPLLHTIGSMGRSSTPPDPKHQASVVAETNHQLRGTSIPRGNKTLKAAAAQCQAQLAAPFSRRVSFSRSVGPMTPSTADKAPGTPYGRAEAKPEAQPWPQPMRPLRTVSNDILKQSHDKESPREQSFRRSSKDASQLFAAVRRRFSVRNRDS